MNLSIRRVFTVTLKSLLAIIGLLVLVIVGLAVYMELKSRPLGSPPPGFEERLKYDLDDPPGPKSTTTVWPNLLSRYEYGRMREKQGLPFEREKDFTLILTEAKPSGSGDNVATEPFHSCKPIIRDEMRSVLYCSKLRKTETSTEGWTHYLPIDESLRTPWYNNPPNAHCKVIMEQGIKRFDACYINFSYNADVDVDMMFIPEQLAIDIITDFKRLTDFLSTLEVNP
jgi:hypothetical protein